MDRALLVLKAIAAHEQPISLDEIADRVQLNKSVTYRLIRSLENAGFVGRAPISGGYSTGTSLLSLSVAVSSRINVRRLVKPAMEQLVRMFGETVSLHVRSGDQRVCVEVVEGTHPVRRVIPVGETYPLFAGETGRVLSSALEDRELMRQSEMARCSGLDPVTFRADAMRIRRHGFIIGIGVRTPEVGSVSLPVHGGFGLMGALTISGPATRWNVASMKAALPRIMEIVRPLSCALGYQTP